MAQQTLTDSFILWLAQSLASQKESLYIAIGAGLPSWDSEGLPSVAPDVSGLVDQKSIKPVSRIAYLTDQEQVSPDPTPILQFTSSMFFAEDYEGSVRECGLFSYDREADRYTLILYSVFSRLDITPQVSLTKNLIINLAL